MLQTLIVIFCSAYAAALSELGNTVRQIQTTPTTSFLTESRYNFLLDMIIQERQLRQNQEKEISSLHTRLQNLEQESTELKANLSLECNQSMNKMIESLSAKTDTIQSMFSVLEKEHESFKQDYYLVRNETYAIHEQLWAITGSQVSSKFQNDSEVNENEINSLKKSITSTNQNVELLLLERTARQQDFLGLVNMATQTNNKVYALEQVQDVIMQNITVIQKMTSESISELEKKIHLVGSTPSVERVAVTACAAFPYQTVGQNQVVHFSNVKSAFGISYMSLNDFENSGVFHCEKPGLYLVSLDLVSKTYDAIAVIRKNAAIITGAYVSFQHGDIWYSGSTTAAVELNLGDRISVQSDRSGIVVHDYSCLTVMKVN